MRRRARPQHALGATLGLLALVAGVLIAAPPGSVRAQDSAPTNWEPTTLTSKVVKLLTPADGVLLAWTGGALHQSTDGRTWQPIELPNRFFRDVAVDPTDSNLMYSIGEGGVGRPYALYRRAPATWGTHAPTWSLTFPIYEAWGNSGSVIAVSPADPTQLFMYLPGRLDAPGMLFRSRDGGAYWDELGEVGPTNNCISADTLILAPHPTAYRRIFRSQSCRGATDLSTELLVSADRGTTWSTSFDPAPRPAFPARLVGGLGFDPNRLYLAATSWRPRVPPEAPDQVWLFRSDDDGLSWSEVATWSGAPGELGEIGGLIYDPARPDRVYLAPGGSAVLASADGGQSWSPLGRQDLPRVNALALSVDGATLYAATDKGVFRLGLP